MVVSAFEPAAVPQPAATGRATRSRATAAIITAAGAATRWAGAHRKLVTGAGTLLTLGGLTVVLAFAQVVAPPIGGLVLDHSAQGFTLLFTAAAVAFLASSLAFLGHRSRQAPEPS